MNEACVAVLFAYKWLHNFVKALDEIKKKKIQNDLMPFVGSLEPLNHQEPIWSVQLPYSVCETAFSQVGLFLD